MDLFHLGDEPEIVGTIIEDDAAVDISAATGLTFYFRTPAGEVVTKTGTLKNSGSDGKLKYQADSAFFPVSARESAIGVWSYECQVTINGHPFTSDSAQFEVADVLRRT